MENKKKLLSKDEIINLVKNVTKDNLNQIIQSFVESKLSINDRKEILRLAFKEKGAGLIRSLYKKTEENFKNILDSDFEKELVELVFNNISTYPDRSFIVVVEELIKNEQDQIDINELFDKYKENGIKLIELAIINDNKQLEDFFKKKLNKDNLNLFEKIKLETINNSKIKKDEIINLVKNVTKANLEQIIQLFIKSKLSISDRKEILRLAFREKGSLLITRLYDETKNNFKNVLDSDFEKELIKLSFNNISKYPNGVFYTVINKLITKKEDQINIINELFDKYKERGIKLIELIALDDNKQLEKFFIEKLGIDNILDKIIECSSNTELFNKFFEINTKNKEGEEFRKYANSIILKIYNIGNKEEMIDSILKNKKYLHHNNILVPFLKEYLLKSAGVDVISLNKVIEKIKNREQSLSEITEIKNIYKNIREKQNNSGKNDKNVQNDPIEIQGENQTEIVERKINYDNDYLIESIKDTVYANLENGMQNNNKPLYEVIYKNDGTQEITYYKMNSRNILAKAIINKNGEIQFDRNINYNKEEIEKILNNNYKSIEGFDHKLSFLSYFLIGNEENIIFKTNCKNIYDIINIISDQNINNDTQNKIFICDLNIDKHNVQVMINNGNINILNTGKDFEYIKNKIEDIINIKCLQNIKVKHLEMINQSEGNCVEASKLYTVILAEKYKNKFNDFKEFSERLNKFEDFIVNILDTTKISENLQRKIKNPQEMFKDLQEIKKKSEEIRKSFKENIKMLKITLEANFELLNKHEKHFYKMDERLKFIYKIIRKTNKFINNEKDKIIDDEMEEMYKVANIIGLGHEINKIYELKKIDNKYKDIINYIINNTKEISENKEINKIEALRKSKILLKIIKNNTKEESIRIKNKKIDKVNDILENKQNKSIEQIFLECIEKIGDSTAKGLGF